MTSVKCQHCDRIIGSPQGLVAHVKSMHPEIATEARQRVGLAAVPNMPPPSNGNGIRWEDPPPSLRGRKASFLAEIEPLTIQLKRNPGRWARLRDYKHKSGASTKRKMLHEHFPDIEFAARAIGDGSAIFARYVEDE